MTEEESVAREESAKAGIDLPEECVGGVVENRRLLASHAALLDDFLAGHPDL